MTPVMASIGLPRETAVAFIFGFFRRDYGAAGLYDLQTKGLIDARQLTVAAVTLTLFVPCVAQFLIMKKERGLKVAGSYRPIRQPPGLRQRLCAQPSPADDGASS